MSAQQVEFNEAQTAAAEAQENARKALAKSRHEANVVRAKALVASGLLVSDHADRLVALCDAISPEASFEFNEGDNTKTETVVDGLFDLLSKQPRKGPSTQEFSAPEVGDTSQLTNEDMAVRIAEYRDEQVAKGRTLSFTRARSELLGRESSSKH